MQAAHWFRFSAGFCLAAASSFLLTELTTDRLSSCTGQRNRRREKLNNSISKANEKGLALLSFLLKC